jgi:hypothetical protein
VPFHMLSMGGADIGECVTTINRVSGDSAENRYRAWIETAEQMNSLEFHRKTINSWNYQQSARRLRRR